MNILIPTAGNRSVLINSFKEQKFVNKVITTEIDKHAPGVFFADKCYEVPKTKQPNYINEILKICEKEKIDVVFPLSDLDLVVFSNFIKLFKKNNIEVFISSKEVLDVSFDKFLTYLFFKENNIPTYKTMLLSEIKSNNLNVEFPIFN